VCLGKPAVELCSDGAGWAASRLGSEQTGSRACDNGVLLFSSLFYGEFDESQFSTTVPSLFFLRSVLEHFNEQQLYEIDQLDQPCKYQGT
jgi:hypothetical protein